MNSLTAACLFFLGMHWIISGSPLRAHIVNILGETVFKVLFSLSIFIALAWMGFAYQSAPYIATWGTAEALKPVSIGLTFFAFLLLPMSIFDKNPTLMGLVPPDQVTTRGMVRITRHAGLIGLGLWGFAHFIVNGDWASHLLFGTIAFEGLIAPMNLDRKYKARYGESWVKFTEQTSYIPFVAILNKRNKLVLSELNIWAALAGTAIFFAVMYFHQTWFGGSPLI
ncbi:MAG: putative membrane protein [Cycloclasticus pugetii]|jgi:uncharacterized membrane protein|uniref:NnrU family protein n=1 Tax=Cycloclasticus TaxID=34067 RepID=UPI000286AB92|nr:MULTISPECIES: NnrU family protein [unclassified Cycloclasticus]AFT66846.1 NnrUfamily protein [Cycloclasticus sp. P1]MBV1897981.1 NnrU family protein [Cycloclasticus sp.]